MPASLTRVFVVHQTSILMDSAKGEQINLMLHGLITAVHTAVRSAATVNYCQRHSNALLAVTVTVGVSTSGTCQPGDATE